RFGTLLAELIRARGGYAAAQIGRTHDCTDDRRSIAKNLLHCRSHPHRSFDGDRSLRCNIPLGAARRFQGTNHKPIFALPQKLLSGSFGIFDVNGMRHYCPSA
ncbi:hypothetical protein, partial [Tabrizicola sp.]|uniref:hypothetical protein n=1 Tax=Tabrizicola sp. TaxID=2005166 RepID=UPI003F2F27C6